MPYLMAVNRPRPTVWPSGTDGSYRDPANPARTGQAQLPCRTELGAGVFANDVTPEAAAAALRNVRL
jgi:hypothetical protein